MQKHVLRILSIVLVLVLAAVPPAGARASTASAAPASQFVRQIGPTLFLNKAPFRFAGSNNYYLMYKSQFMVDDVLETAAASGFRVLRIWGSLDIGNQDGSNSVAGIQDGVYFQYWDGDSPAYNDGPNGLERLDYAVYKAGQEGIKLVIPFVNNWNAFGGMDQYVRWRDGAYHDAFYTDPVIRQWYKDWITHLLERTNIYTGVQYKDDPTIMTWELANEPRCLSAGAYPRSPDCTTETLVEWADDVSTYIKSIDANHLVSVGDEGFYCIPGASDWTENCGEGVDTLAFTRLENIDVMSFHLYPDHWGKDAAWGTQWIKRHFADALLLDKPAMLGEYGWQDRSTRNLVFREWTNAVFKSHGAGALYWILSGYQDNGALYPDYDGFTVYCPSPVCITLANFAQMMTRHRTLFFPPVADDDSAQTEFATPLTLAPLANDLAYGPARLLPDTLDLDPQASGAQHEVTVYGGTFAWQPGGLVTFTPAEGFSGKAQAAYTVLDSAKRRSNVAALLVTVKPDPTGAQILFSFETGTEGWAGGSWQTDPGTTAQTTEFATDGQHGLKVISNSAWFTVVMPAPLDVSSKTTFKYDLQTLGAGTSISVAFQFGDGWSWCQSPSGWANAGTTTTIEVDMLSLGCSSPDMSKLQAINIWFGNGTFNIDKVTVE